MRPAIRNCPAGGENSLAFNPSPRGRGVDERSHGGRNRQWRSKAGVREGSLLLEAVLAIGLFTVFLAGIGFSLVLGEGSTLKGGDRIRAAFLAEQQLEAVRGIRNQNFDFLPVGTHGLQKTSTGWVISGTSGHENGYETKMEIVSLAPDWLEVTSGVSWRFGESRSGTSALRTYLTDWRKTSPLCDWAHMSLIANIIVDGSPDLQKISVGGNFAYLTGSAASGGKGLYVYDVTNPASPLQVAVSFTLYASGFESVVEDGKLYVATDDIAKEIQVYDVSSPENLSSANLVMSFDLPGIGKARSVAVYGNNVFVGTLDEPPNDQFYALRMSETGGLSLLDSLHVTGSVLDITLSGNYAYIASSNNSAELMVISVADPVRLKFANGVGADMTDVQDAASVAISGTAAIVGRFDGTGIDELTMYSTENSPVPAFPPGPWTLEMNGDIRSLDRTFGRYDFAAGNADGAQLRVIDRIKLEQNGAAILKTFDAEAAVNGIFYDWQKDRLFLVTPSSFMVFAPGP